MVMLPEPLYLCHEALTKGQHVHTVMMSAQGSPFHQDKARELLAREHFIIVCGHYEGIDQRFIDTCVDEEISIGDFVLTGGEIPAMAVADAVCPAWFPACFQMKLPFRRKATGMGFWNIRNIPTPLCGAIRRYQKYFYPVIMQTSPAGDAKCRFSVPCRTVPTSIKPLSRRINRTK